MKTTIDIEIVGLGIIFYSPFAVRHIPVGQDYLEPHFWKPEDVARHVNSCEISAFGTGGPGRYLLQLYDGALDLRGMESAKASVQLGIEVRDRSLCFRDLYDLISWDPACPSRQTVSIPDGFYRVTAYTSPEPGLVDGQVVWLHLQQSADRPRLNGAEVPDLSGEP